MKSFKATSGGVNMFAIKHLINLISVKLHLILILCVLMGLAMGCSAEGEIKGEIKGGTVNLPAMDRKTRAGLLRNCRKLMNLPFRQDARPS